MPLNSPRIFRCEGFFHNASVSYRPRPGMIAYLRSPRVLTVKQIKMLCEPELGPIEDLEFKAEEMGFRIILRVQKHILHVHSKPADRLRFGQLALAFFFDRNAWNNRKALNYSFTVESVDGDECEAYDIMARLARLLIEDQTLALAMR